MSFQIKIKLSKDILYPAQLFILIFTIFLPLPDIEVANRHGHTCLMIACYKGHYKIAKFLISIQADVNRKSVKGNTALHDCAESGSLDIMKLLLANKAKIDVDAYGEKTNLSQSLVERLWQFLLPLSIKYRQ